MRNPIFIPETQIEGAPYNALYAYGEARAFGFSPFAIDSLKLPANDADPKPEIMQVYDLLDSMRDLLPTAQAEGLTRGMALHTTSPRPTRTIALGGYLIEATLSRLWPSRTIAADNGAMLILQASPDEFYIVGSGLTVSFARDPDVDGESPASEPLSESLAFQDNGLQRSTSMVIKPIRVGNYYLIRIAAVSIAFGYTPSP